MYLMKKKICGDMCNCKHHGKQIMLPEKKGDLSKTRKGGKDYETHMKDKDFHRDHHLQAGKPYRTRT